MTQTTPQRITAKLFARPDPGPELDLEPFIGLFHRFIQERTVEGLLLDVADYAHVPQGPGILLVGHDVDYGIDLAGGRTGLLVTRKRYGAALDWPELLGDLLRHALGAALAIERSGVGGLRFGLDLLELSLLDRLATPHEPQLRAELAPRIEAALGPLVGGSAVEIRPASDDPRSPLAFQLAFQPPPEARSLLETLGGVVTSQEDLSDLSVAELKELRDSGADFVLLDVREPDEYEICNLGGQLIPLGQLQERLSELDAGAEIVVHCKMGGRGQKAVEILRGAGFARVRNVAGGILAWIDEIDPSLSRY